MDRFDSLQLFVRIVELGSFTRAAGVLDIPRATATHALKKLEARLGTRLLERTTRQVRPTSDGQAFYERCVHLLAELDDAESSLSTVAGNPRGTLRLDLHGTHATQIVLPRIDEFRRRYPQVDLAVSSGDRLVDLVREGIDCVVRAGTPKDSSLVARRLAVLPEVVCASPDYLAHFGTPRHPGDLATHQAVGFFASSHDRRYPFELVVDGSVVEYELPGWIAVNDAEAYVACALRGCGLVQLPRYHVEHELREGSLVEVLPQWRSTGVTVSAMYPQHRQLSPRVRAFVDWVAQVYAERFGSGE
ncbi:MAG TPA: LysR family transcriptional regulator [Tahibacter sp.]|uniref:LysR family transcriptional regulator n=1 Tax=Tahibacter sp. TaxID=2056211 RepID=UPI002D05DD39|nr:LysR family transcriptional regulator [Tahibacter sp.]HSX59559.1 LysR family transcriptional regulator [Tahibacter sp.]